MRECRVHALLHPLWAVATRRRVVTARLRVRSTRTRVAVVRRWVQRHPRLDAGDATSGSRDRRLGARHWKSGACDPASSAGHRCLGTQQPVVRSRRPDGRSRRPDAVPPASESVSSVPGGRTPRSAVALAVLAADRAMPGAGWRSFVNARTASADAPNASGFCMDDSAPIAMDSATSASCAKPGARERRSIGTWATRDALGAPLLLEGADSRFKMRLAIPLIFARTLGGARPPRVFYAPLIHNTHKPTSPRTAWWSTARSSHPQLRCIPAGRPLALVGWTGSGRPAGRCSFSE